MFVGVGGTGVSVGGTGVNVAVGSGVLVGRGVAVATGVEVSVGVAVKVGRAVRVGRGVGVGVRKAGRLGRPQPNISSVARQSANPNGRFDFFPNRRANVMYLILSKKFMF